MLMKSRFNKTHNIQFVHNKRKKITLSLVLCAILFLGLQIYPSGHFIPYASVSTVQQIHMNTIQSLLSSYKVLGTDNISNENYFPNITTGIVLEEGFAFYLPGEMVHIFFWNGNKTQIALANSTPLRIDKEENNAWKTIYTAKGLASTIFVKPHSYVHFVWDQKNNEKIQVHDGKYRVVINTTQGIYTKNFTISKIFGKFRQGLLDIMLNDSISDSQVLDVIAIFNRKVLETDIRKLTLDIGNFTLSKIWNNTINGFVAKMRKMQVMRLAEYSFIKYIRLNSIFHLLLDSARYYTGVDEVVNNYGVTGDRDGNENSYSKNDIVIAILDTGVDSNHVDLDGGKIIGWKDFVNNKPTPYDDTGHGTHVASIAAGTGEGNYKYKGVAPGAAIVAVKVFDADNSAPRDRIIDALDWVKQNKDTYGIDIVLLALGDLGGHYEYDEVAQKADELVAAGLIVVTGAGNYGPSIQSITTPGIAKHVITVGAVADPAEGGWTIYSGSSRGPTRDGDIKPDIVAPGVSIKAAKYGTINQYWEMTGTSMATALVAGLVALIIDYDYSLKINLDKDGDGNPDVKELLMGKAIDMGDAGKDNTYGAGRVDGDEVFWYLEQGDSGADYMSSATVILSGLGEKWIYDEPLWDHDIVDWYSVYAPARSYIYVKCIPEGSLDVKVIITDLYGRTLASVDPSEGNTGIIRYYVIYPGYFFIKIERQSGLARYDLYTHIY